MNPLPVFVLATAVSVAKVPAAYSTDIHQLLSLSAAVQSEPFLRTAPDFTLLVHDPGHWVESSRVFPSKIPPGPTWTPIGWQNPGNTHVDLYAEKPWLERARSGGLFEGPLDLAFDTPWEFGLGAPVIGPFAELTFLIGLGGVLEDSTWIDPDVLDPRFLRHFTDPQNGYAGLKDTEGSYSGGSLELEGRSESSLRWLRNPVNEFSIDRLIELYALAVSAPHPDARRCYAEQLFVGLGSQVHLIEDACQPSHVRDDSHSDMCLPDGSSLLELYGQDLIASTASAAAAVDIIEQGRANAELYAPTAVFYEDYLRICAEKVSRTFFSDDSINSKPALWSKVQGGPGSPVPMPIFDVDYSSIPFAVTLNPSKTSPGVALETRESGDRVLVYRGDEMPHHDLARLVYHEPGWFPTGGTRLSLVFDEGIAADNARVLLPFAQASARGFLDYFFRGQLDVGISGEDLIIQNVGTDRAYAPTALCSPTLRIGDLGQGAWWFGLLSSDGFLHSPMKPELIKSTLATESLDVGARLRFEGLARALSLERHLLAPLGGMEHARGVAVFVGKIGYEQGVAFRTFELSPVDRGEAILGMREIEATGSTPPGQALYELDLAPGLEDAKLEGKGSTRFDGLVEVDSEDLFLAQSDAFVSAQHSLPSIGWSGEGFGAALGMNQQPAPAPYPSYTNVSVRLLFADRHVSEGGGSGRRRGTRNQLPIPTVEATARAPKGFTGTVRILVPLTHGSSRAKHEPAGFVTVIADFDGTGDPARTRILLGR